MLVWIRLHGSELWEAVAEGRVWSCVSWEGPRAVPANLPVSLLLDSGLQGPGWLLSWGHLGTVDTTGDFSAPSSLIALGFVPPGLLPALSWCPLSCPAIPPSAQHGQCTASAVLQECHLGRLQSSSLIYTRFELKRTAENHSCLKSIGRWYQLLRRSVMGLCHMHKTFTGKRSAFLPFFLPWYWVAASWYMYFLRGNKNQAWRRKSGSICCLLEHDGVPLSLQLERTGGKTCVHLFHTKLNYK